MVKATIAWNVKQISKAVELGSMSFDNVIQRGYVWDRKKQSLLVDSIIRNYPVPPIYTIKTDIDAPEGCKKGSKVFDCIDGKQRCEALRAFRHNEFELEGLDDEELNGKTYDELTEEQRDDFDGFTMTVYYFTEITDDEIADMMARLNNGKPLSGVENARIKCKNLPVIISLAEHNLFKQYMTEVAIKGYHNEDVVIKTAMQKYYDVFELSTKNVKSAYETIDLEEDKINFLNSVFTYANKVIDTTFTISKKIARRVLKKTNLVSLLYLIATAIPEEELTAEDNTASVEVLAKFTVDFFNGNEAYANALEAYDGACTNGTNHASNVKTRNTILADTYKRTTTTEVKE